METPEQECAAIAEYIRLHERDIVAQVEGMKFDPEDDLAESQQRVYLSLADTWKHRFRRKPEYVAWRRERQPGYEPPDEPDPNAWENLTDVQKFERRRAERHLARMGEQLVALPPERRRVFAYVHRRQRDMFGVAHRLHTIGERGDEQARALAGALSDGLMILQSMIAAIASDGATVLDSELDAATAGLERDYPT